MPGQPDNKGKEETMPAEITISELSAETGFSVSHLTHLVRRGILPEGRKEGKSRYLPFVESKLILLAHKPDEHWKKSGKRNSRKSSAKAVQELSWEALV